MVGSMWLYGCHDVSTWQIVIHINPNVSWNRVSTCDMTFTESLTTISYDVGEKLQGSLALIRQNEQHNLSSLMQDHHAPENEKNKLLSPETQIAYFQLTNAWDMNMAGQDFYLQQLSQSTLKDSDPSTNPIHKQNCDRKESHSKQPKCGMQTPRSTPFYRKDLSEAELCCPILLSLSTYSGGLWKRVR